MENVSLISQTKLHMSKIAVENTFNEITIITKYEL